MRAFMRSESSSLSTADCCQFSGRWWGVGLGAGVGGEAGAEGSKFGGIEVTVLVLVLLLLLLWRAWPWPWFVVLDEDETSGLERPPVDSRGCAVASCSDALRGVISPENKDGSVLAGGKVGRRQKRRNVARI